MNRILTISAFIFLFCSNLLADWQKVNSHPNTLVTNIVISGSTIYTSSYTGVRKSTNGMVSWQLINNGLNNPQAIRCKQVLVYGSNMYAATEDGIYGSTNEGADWVRKSDGILLGNGALYLFAESIYEINGMLVTGAYSGIYLSTNAGENWILTNITGQHIWAKNFTPYNNILYAAREVGNIPGSYSSTDNGITWQPYSLQANNLPVITFYNDGPRLYAGTITGVYLTTNSGASWVQKNNGLTPDPYSSSILRVNDVLITALKFGGSGMFISYNNGDLWIDFGQGLPFLTDIDKLIQFNNKLLIGTSDGVFERNVSELTGITQISNEIPDNFSLGQNYPNPFNPETKINFSIPAVEDAYMRRVQLIVFNIAGREVQTMVSENLQPGSYEVSFDGSSLSSGTYYYSLAADGYRTTKKMVLLK